MRKNVKLYYPKSRDFWGRRGNWERVVKLCSSSNQEFYSVFGIETVVYYADLIKVLGISK